MRVANIISPDMIWDLGLFSQSFPQSVFDIILSIPLNPLARGKDIPIWRTASGYYTSKAAYAALFFELLSVDGK